MGLFYFDRDSLTGIYLSDKDMEYASTALGWGMGALGALAVFYWVIFAAMMIILSPFITLFVLDDFVEVFVANNALVFSALCVLITVLKFIRKTAASWIVRFLFDAYLLFTVVYIMLYVLHFSDPVYAVFRTIDNYLPENANISFAMLIGEEKLKAATEGSWFYSMVDSCVNWGMDAIMSMAEKARNIDSSCFQNVGLDMNILEMLKTIGQYLLYGGGVALGMVLGVVAAIVMYVLLLVLPYVAAFLLMIMLNKFIYRLHCGSILAIRQGEKFEKAAAICRGELDAVMKNPGFYGQAKVFEIYERIAKEGNPVAQVCCAQCYYHGEGVTQDDKKAFYWYHKAALQGSTKGQLMTAIYYLEGNGVKKNKLLARAWFKAALKNREYIDRHREKPSVVDMLTKVAKKTRFVECL